LALAHNVAEIWDWKEGYRVYSQPCSELCILSVTQRYMKMHITLLIFRYSAILEDSLMLCGTVFNEILVWNILEGHGKVLRRLKGHEVC
jgi:hypothetical protein